MSQIFSHCSIRWPATSVKIKSAVASLWHSEVLFVQEIALSEPTETPCLLNHFLLLLPAFDNWSGKAGGPGGNKRILLFPVTLAKRLPHCSPGCGSSECPVAPLAATAASTRTQKRQALQSHLRCRKAHQCAS